MATWKFWESMGGYGNVWEAASSYAGGYGGQVSRPHTMLHQ